MINTASHRSANGAAERWVSGRRARVLIAASGVSFMIMLDSNIVAVSLPAIARSLNAAFSDIEWVVSAYVLAFASLLMAAGALADRFGRRRILLYGIALFTLASALCGLASSSAVLNYARALQGLGAALQLSAALATLGHEFRGPDRARAFGFWGTVIGVAVTAGPLVGGVITSTLGWRWAFLINLPIGIFLLALAANAVEESRDPLVVKLDLSGIVFFGAGLSFLVWALIDGNSAGWTSQATAFKFIAALVLLAAFIVAERLQERPMVDLSLFRNPYFLGGSVAMLGFASSAQVMMTYLPLYLQNGFDYSAAWAGLGMLPFALPLFVFPRIAVSLGNRISGRAVLTLGLLAVAFGNISVALFVANDTPYPFVALGMLFTGAGAGLLNGETAKVSMSHVPPERGGMASGIGGTLRFVGLVIGITGLGALLASATQASLLERLRSQGMSSDKLNAFTSRVISGDLAGAASSIPEDQRSTLLALARSSFASGFTMVVLVAGIVAAFAALMTYLLLAERGTRLERPVPDRGEG